MKHLAIPLFPFDLYVYTKKGEYKKALAAFDVEWEHDDQAGYVMPDGQHVHLWLSDLKHVPLLAHELLHVTRYVLDTCGVDDEECTAYMLQALMEELI